MTRVITILGCLSLAGIISGCATVGSDSSGPIGNSIILSTSEPAPSRFDAWEFRWEFPAIERFDADLESVVLLPDDGELTTSNFGIVTPGGHVRTGFNERTSRFYGKPEILKREALAPFYGKNIRILVRATKGRIRFSNQNLGTFFFYVKDKDGRLNECNPIKSIKAVAK